jgi:ribosome biogenesis GTPase A
MTLPSEKKWSELRQLMASLHVYESDLVETYIKGSGKGGQKQNKRSNCVQIKHLPSSIVVKCQTDRSREANRFFARRSLCQKIQNQGQEAIQTASIQWFPGHMAKAIREISESLKKVTLVIEILDARCPFSSRNPTIDELISHKPHIIVLNKSDLASPKITQEWSDYFSSRNILVIATNGLKKEGIKQLEKACLSLSNKDDSAVSFKEVRAMIVGIPNVGKSAIINACSGKKTAKVENRPAVTKRQQWISVSPSLTLLDTPGILWPKFDDQIAAKHLAITGSIKSHLLDSEALCFFLIEYLLASFPEGLLSRYKLEEIKNTSVLSVIESIGQKRGCIGRGGAIDYDKTYDTILTDYKKGKLGRVSLETPPLE